jgi:RimJ/RimL family protein N-acetyltransferase
VIGDGTVTLREPDHADVDALVAACQDPEILRWTAIPDPYGPQDARDWIELDEDRFVLVDGEDRILGAVGLLHPECEPEIGYWVAAEARGRGVATRGLQLMREWAVSRYGARRIILLIHEDNVASQGVAVRAGFQDTGERRPCPRGRCSGDVPDHRVYAWSDE